MRPAHLQNKHSELLSVVVAHDEAGIVVFFDRSGRREARSRITPGFRYFVMAAAFAALSLDRFDARGPKNE